MSGRVEWVAPDWPAPAQVRVISTLRTGGASAGAYSSLNLAAHVGDDPRCVRDNRLRLRLAAGLPAEPLWLEQVHGRDVVVHDQQAHAPRADAAIATTPHRVCAVMTADCLPVVLADAGATRVGVAHAGWRGLAAGVVEATIAALGVAPAGLHAWLGPSIGQSAFEVGGEVRQAFVAIANEAAACFAPNGRGRFQADLYGLARLALARAGVKSVHGGDWCTATDRDRFFSFRRDGVTGRMATLAWLERRA
ncbi:MAG TPA: peptidoglycan editing factor PgeF [Steroidobacteraceae bacterium]|nr:peptidoglycan editing factor PgeF [Steroidobacteraceae bacterium]